jgi:ribonuclease J
MGKKVGIRVLGGAGTIGGNKVHVGWEGASVLLDFGMDFSANNRFYGDLLAPRTSRGIHDLMRFGLLPPLADYRADLVPEDMDISSFSRLGPDAVLLSHAHLDHCGHIGYLDESVPLVASAQCMAIVKGMMDQRSNVTRSAVYHAGKVGGRSEYCGRDRLVVGERKEGLIVFLERSVRRAPIEECRSLDEDDLPFSFTAHPVDHSIYGAMAYSLHTPKGTVVYTGDVRTHGKQGKITWSFAERAAKEHPKVLIVEGTRIDREGCVGEEDVARNCALAMEGEEGLVVVDFSSRDFERLETFKHLASTNGRELVITRRDAYMLDALREADGVDRAHGCRIFAQQKERIYGWERSVDDGHGEDMVTMAEIASEPSGFILCFSQYELPHMLDARGLKGCYIYSSTEAFDVEMEIGLLRLYNWIDALGLRPVGLERVKEEGIPKVVNVPGFHASGHASGEDLVHLIQVIDPEYVMPVHTERPELFVKLLKDRNVVLPRAGLGLDLEL